MRGLPYDTYHWGVPSNSEQLVHLISFFNFAELVRDFQVVIILLDRYQDLGFAHIPGIRFHLVLQNDIGIWLGDKNETPLQGNR